MTIPKFQKLILNWSMENRRDMPWRNTHDPYKILVSEVMLQQTQVARVLLKYKEFLKEFPTLQSLARASDKKLLFVWAGLGYWKRALSLKKTAQIIARNYQGKFPKEPTLLTKLPGIGPYTAGAVACFAFGHQEAFLDTNIRRVYLYFFFPPSTSSGQTSKKVSDKEILAIAQKALISLPNHGTVLIQPIITPREWHYALLDYGAVALKDKRINKQSQHYKKQSKFTNSFRSFRAQVLHFLLQEPKQTATINKIEKLLTKVKSPYKSKEILLALTKDGLVKKKGTSYSI
ncbi:MAG: A/G-specific adenine glycosylase [bacterium]|nr:A/G-specific adenine glycosylase [bacterium]